MKWASFAQLSAILAAAARPLDADFAGDRFIQLYLYVHRVDELQPGVYRYWPQHAQLEQIRSGDQRVAAAGLSLGQDLAGNACVAFSMIGDLDHAVRAHGDRGYRYVHFEAGAVGHRLYLAAEARSEWERPASERSMMTRYTVISISHRSKDKSYTISRLVIRFTIHESVPNRVLHFTAVRRHYHSVKILTACTVHVNSEFDGDATESQAS